MPHQAGQRKPPRIGFLLISIALNVFCYGIAGAVEAGENGAEPSPAERAFRTNTIKVGEALPPGPTPPANSFVESSIVETSAKPSKTLAPYARSGATSSAGASSRPSSASIKSSVTPPSPRVISSAGAAKHLERRSSAGVASKASSRGGTSAASSRKPAWTAKAATTQTPSKRPLKPQKPSSPQKTLQSPASGMTKRWTKKPASTIVTGSKAAAKG